MKSYKDYENMIEVRDQHGNDGSLVSYKALEQSNVGSEKSIQ